MSLLIWLPLQGTLENKGTVQGITIDGHSSNVDSTHGKLSLACQHFTRTDTPTSYISFPAQLTASSQFTYACWFNTASIAQNQCLFSQRSVGDGSGYSIFYMGASTNANADKLRFDDGAGLYSDGKISSANKWYHLAFVRTATQKLIYINGSLSGSGAINTPTNVNNNYILIGGSQANAAGSSPTANGLNGYLQDVRLYDNALSAAEIKNLAKGLMVHYKCGDYVNRNLFNDTASTYSQTAYLAYQINLKENLVSGKQYTLQLWDVDVYHSAKTASQTGIGFYWGGSAIRLALRNGTSYYTLDSDTGYYHTDYLSVTFTVDNSTSNNKYIRFYNSPTNATGTRYMRCGRWKIEEGNTGTPWITSSITSPQVIDSSGYDNYGNITGSIRATKGNTTRFANSLNILTQASNFSSTNAIGTSESAFSFNLWYKASEYYDSGLILRQKLNSNLLFNFGCTDANDASTHQFNVFRSGTNYITYKDFEIPIDEWHMWTGTYDGTTVKLYKDGILLGSATSQTSYSLTYTDGNTFLGSTSIKSMQGYASDIRMYATVLDAATIKEFYDTALKIGNYGDVHSYEFVEDNNTVNLYKNGQLIVSEIVEDNTLTNTKLIGTTWYAPEFIES